MNATLIHTARTNRVAALEYIQAKKQRGGNDSKVLCLMTMREKLKNKPVFLTRRVHRLEERLVA